MTAEYLVFDLVVLGPLVLMALARPRWVDGAVRPALWATAWAAVPFVAWDAAVAGRHWWFSEAYTLGPKLFGLPLEELGFFLVVPLGCLTFWELALKATTARPHPALRLAFLLPAALLLPAAWAWSTGREYTAMSCLALALAALLDAFLGTAVLSLPKGWAHLGATVGFTAVFNGYLTARPVVLYDERFQIPFRVGTIPLEDFGFGLALVLLTTALYQRARGRQVRPSPLARLIERRLGGYRHVVEQPDEALPGRLAAPRTVAVVGAGLAGLTAAELLSRRGFQVTVIDRNPYLGGKLASWKEDGVEIEHGFHAFFRHYFNLLHWLGELGVAPTLRAIDDYLLLGRDGRAFSFRGVQTVPALNLLALKAKGLYRWRDVMRRQTGEALRGFLEYHPTKTREAMDTTSFADFAKAAALPPSLFTVFTMFSRAFFADAERMSMGELVKSFHFYYLSHDAGLLFEHLDGSTRETLMDPLRARLEAQGVRLRLGQPVASVDGGDGLTVDGERFDAVVVACDVAAARKLLSPSLVAATPELAGLPSLRAGQRYAVLRLWLSTPVGGDEMPAFVSTERDAVLDAFAFAHRVDADARAHAAAGGAVLELHCYAVPDALAKEQLAPALEKELARFLPGFDAAKVTRRHLQVRDDFTAFHVGQSAFRPPVETSRPGLVLAGDWVALPFPAMLMEAAHASGRLAANALCRKAGVRTFPVWSVPPRGLLAPR